MTHWIKDPADLAERLRDPPARIGLDTEFIRERTYWPQLALVQMAIGDDILVIDPLVPGMADALRPILVDPAVTKVMHSASEDLITFKCACGVLPSPLFDTQVAAGIAGLAAGMGYQRLVADITGVALAKGETRSDWMRRPLSPAQLDYAADDVRYLFPIHDELMARLEALGRVAWLEEDCQKMLDTAANDAGEPWPHLAIRTSQFLDAPAQARLLRLLRWRDVVARSSDKPRSWILDNELAVLLARTPPHDRDALQALLDGHPKAPKKLGDALWLALTESLPDEHAMPLARAQDDRDKAALKRLQEAVAVLTLELQLPDGVLASRRYLEQLLEQGGWADQHIGWRRTQLEPMLSEHLSPRLQQG